MFESFIFIFVQVVKSLVSVINIHTCGMTWARIKHTDKYLLRDQRTAWQLKATKMKPCVPVEISSFPFICMIYGRSIPAPNTRRLFIILFSIISRRFCDEIYDRQNKLRMEHSALNGELSVGVLRISTRARDRKKIVSEREDIRELELCIMSS